MTFQKALVPLFNMPMLVRVLGWLMLIEAIFMLLPLTVCLLYGESDWIAFAGGAGLTGLCGFLMARNARPHINHLGKRDGYLLTASVWVVFSIFGMVPFILSATHVSITDAFFEAMSGFTTTGSTVIPQEVVLSHGMHVWRALMQWLGGLGIILFTIAVIPMLNHSGGLQMINAEMAGITSDKIRPRISQTAKSLWGLYIILTMVLTLLLWAGPMDFFDSICHALGTISTGGYTTAGNGVAHFHSVYTKAVITVFMFLGSVNFTLIFRAVTGDWQRVRHNDIFIKYILVILVATALFVLTIIFRSQAYTWRHVTIDPLFQVVSLISSTGYMLSAYPTWGPFVLGLGFLMMICGGCSGSTTGGVKLDRIVDTFKNCRNELMHCIYPHRVYAVRSNGKAVSPDTINKISVFLTMFALVTAAGTLALTMTGVDIYSSFFSVLSCVTNDGLGAGVIEGGVPIPALPAAAKWVLTAAMLIGRLEIFTILLLFTRSFWRR